MKYIILIAFLIGISQAAIEADKVVNMPEWPQNLNFTMYSGLLSVRYTDEKKIHYVLITKTGELSTKNKAPLVIWFNGGPGCSSLDGFLSEHGPFVFEDDQTALNGSFNPWSWNNAANMLYIEAPAGVGFSPSSVPYTGDNYNDNVTMVDNYEALLTFFEGFPELLDNELWVTGESYAGMYVPWLAAYIDEQNKDAKTKMNLKGVMVGDGVISMDYEVGLNTSMQMVYGHHLISKQHYDLFLSYCEHGNVNNLKCQTILKTIFASLAGINPYDVYGYCYPPYAATGGCFVNEFDYYDSLGQSVVPCVYTEGETTYLNRQDVKEALHVDTSTNWSICSSDVSGAFRVNRTGSVSQYEHLMKRGYRILLYTGDADLCVPFQNTEYNINNVFKLKIKSEWKPWYTGDQVGGHVIEYHSRVTYVTVRGAGHMVPQTRRAQAYQMFESFLHDKPLAEVDQGEEIIELVDL